jgi:hypothetical protein
MYAYRYRMNQVRLALRLGIALAVALLLLTAIGLVIEVALGPHPQGSTVPPPVQNLFSTGSMSTAPAGMPAQSAAESAVV